MPYSDEFRVRTATYVSVLIICIILVIFQAWNLVLQVSLKSNGTNIIKRNISPFQLMFPLLCSNIAFIVALIAYISTHLGLFGEYNCIFCDLTIPLGGILYVIGKCGIYIFYAIRASVSQGIIQNFPKYFTNILIPAYIVIVFIVYCVCFPLLFKGECNSNINILIIDTGCDLGEYPGWMLWLGSFADIATNLLFVAIFAYPLLKSYHMTEDAFKNKGFKKHKFVTTMKWNLSLTAINATSTSLSMFLIAAFSDYWWLYTLDFAINGVSSFLMMGINRRFLKYNICCLCYYKQIMKEKQKQEELSTQRSLRHSKQFHLNLKKDSSDHMNEPHRQSLPSLSANNRLSQISYSRSKETTLTRQSSTTCSVDTNNIALNSLPTTATESSIALTVSPISANHNGKYEDAVVLKELGMEHFDSDNNNSNTVCNVNSYDEIYK